MLLPLREFSYLTAQNAPVYRVLMRLLHEASVMQQRHVAPEDLLMRARDAGLQGLTPDSLQSHLDALVDWGNVGQRRDTARVESLSEYARRRNLYHATPRGLAIENFLESGLDAAEETAAVSAGTVSRLETQWGELTELLEAGQDEEFELAWTALYRDFRALSEDVRALTVSLERQLSLDDLEQFLEFKGVVRSYVERLAAELAGPGQRLRVLVQAFGREEALVETLTGVRAGRLTRGATLLAEAQAKETARKELESLRGWLTRPPEQGDGLEFGITALRGAVAQVLAFIEAVRRTHEL
ncbi:MAG: DUF2397 family protein, partial [Deinococcus sp.]|nr:DUF2397 family protein [Deinococcus sp.]